MSKIKHHVVDVRRDELLTVQRTVPAWELPLLQAVHGAENVAEVGAMTLERDVPHAGDEYQRLETRYGKSKRDDNSDGPPYISLVYGESVGGVRALHGAIQSAAEDSDEAAAPANPAVAFADLIGSRTN